MTKLTLSLSAAALAFVGASVALAQHHDGMTKPDADGDGSVTRAEMQSHGAQMFARLDVNGDGAIGAADREARQAQRFAAMDTDNDGELSQAEMRAAHEARHAKREERRAASAEHRAEHRDDRMAEHFDRMDADNSGGLSQAELATRHDARAEDEHRGKRGHRMGGMGGDHGAMRMMHGMLRQADADGDKSVTRAEFDAALARHFSQVDADGNGAISAAERQSAHEAMRAKWQERREQRRAQ